VTRRFGGAGLRRPDMRGGDQVVGGEAPPSPPTIESLWAEYGADALFWFDASGLDVDGQTWTDRVAGYVLEPGGDAPPTLSVGTLGSAPAVVITYDDADWGGVESAGTVPGVIPARVFVAGSGVDILCFWEHADTDNARDRIFRVGPGFAEALGAGWDEGAEGGSAAVESEYAGDPAVVMVASEFAPETTDIKINGAAASPTGSWTTTAVAPSEGTKRLATYGDAGDLAVIAIKCAFPHAWPHAAAFEAALLEIAGIT
jgi:hypothetical protein